jgi:hypothetical protein
MKGRSDKIKAKKATLAKKALPGPGEPSDGTPQVRLPADPPGKSPRIITCK